MKRFLYHGGIGGISVNKNLKYRYFCNYLGRGQQKIGFDLLNSDQL